jgi:hypothetical protein
MAAQATTHPKMEDEDEISPEQEVDFCTLGMFIIGEGLFFHVLILFLTSVNIEVEPCLTVSVVSAEVPDWRVIS